MFGCRTRDGEIKFNLIIIIDEIEYKYAKN